MLDGIITPRLFVDDAEVATWALLQERAEGAVYIGDAPTPDDLSTAIYALRQLQDVLVCAWPASGFTLDSLPSPDYTGVAVDFTDRSPAVDLAPLTVTKHPFDVYA